MDRLGGITLDEKVIIEECYERSNKMLWNLAFRLLKDEADAYDVTQTAYLQLMICLPKISSFPPEKTDAYLVGIAKKLAYRCYSSRKKAIPSDRLDTIPANANLELSMECQMLGAQNRERLRNAMSKLSQRYRYMINAKFFGGLADVEIAKILQVKPASVRMLQSRAIRALMKEFDRMGSSCRTENR